MSGLEEFDLSKKPEEEEEEMEEQPEEEVEEKEEEKTLGDYLAEFAGAPDARQIELWKQQHGEVLCSGMSETELFVFRPITREEFTNLQAYLAQQKQQVSDSDVEVKIVDSCILWASAPGLASLEKKAGTYSTLHEQILQASNFMNPAMVSQFVFKL